MTQEQAGGLVPEFTVAERLWLARDLKGLKQDELAELIDAGRSTVRNYENRGYTSKRKQIVLKRWALATGVSLEWLETGEGAPGGPGNDGARETTAAGGSKLARLTAQKQGRVGGSSTTRRYPEAA